MTVGIRKHYTNLSIQDVFRKIKADNPGYLLAFGVSDVFEFRGCDAVAVHEALPDVLFDTEVDFKRITVHKFAFFPFCARLKACGLKVAMVARHRVPGKRVYYEISGKSDE